MKTKIAALALALSLALSGCGASVTEGKVTNKESVAEHTEKQEIVEEECAWDTDRKTVNGKTKTTREYECEDVPTGEFEDVVIPAEYTLVLTNEDGDTGEVSVDEDTYNATEIGEFYKEN